MTTTPGDGSTGGVGPNCWIISARTGSIDRSKATNAMTVRFLFPDQDAWLGGQRTVACMIVNPTADLTSSLLNP